jgi:hypothetical protein
MTGTEMTWTGRRPKGRSDVVRQGAEGETLLYDPIADAVHVVNPTAATVWELCDGTHTGDELVTEVRRRFATTGSHDVTADVFQLLDLFEREGLLEPTGTSGS